MSDTPTTPSGKAKRDVAPANSNEKRSETIQSDEARRNRGAAGNLDETTRTEDGQATQAGAAPNLDETTKDNDDDA